MAKPFLKWAGGKGRQAEEIASTFPRRYGRYLEPFLGGGAVFFHLQSGWAGPDSHRPILSDACSPLMAAYEAVRDWDHRFLRSLRQLSNEYGRALVRTTPFTLDVFERVRRSFNRRPNPADFVFLNRTCFNGLWRVNSRGEFNVPHAGYANPTIYNLAGLAAVQRALASAALTACDFANALLHAERGDLAYCDPPYWPRTTTSNFTGYVAGGFGPLEQERLAEHASAAVRRGAYVALSNHDLPEVRKLYKGFKLRKRSAVRRINSDGAKRGAVPELLITSWS